MTGRAGESPTGNRAPSSYPWAMSALLAVLAPVVARHATILRLTAEETPTPVPTPSSSTSPEPSDGPTTTVQQTVEAVAETTVNMISLAWRAGIGASAGIVLAFILIMALRLVGRRQAFCAELAHFCRNALYATGALIGAYLGSQVALIDLTSTTWADIVSHTLLLSAIAAFTWLIARFLYAVAATVIKGAQAGGDAGRANRVTTQPQILRRVAVVIVIICGIVGMVMTFPAARFAMTSLLASAGLVSVVAGLAAQSTLGNVFAGLQLAATDAIRVDDVVEVKDWNGQIEEITLTYVVVRLWDERRLILPSTYFTQNPFTNWTRRSHQLTGSLTLELDWRVPVSQLRTELDRILSTTKLWDGRTSALVVSATSATSVTVRITLSAGNQPNSYALQCLVREALIDWMQREAPYALPRTRVEVEQVEVTHDPEPEQVAQMAEEIVRRRKQAEEEQAQAEAQPEQDESEPGESGEPAWSVTRLLRRARRERDRLLLRSPGLGPGSNSGSSSSSGSSSNSGSSSDSSSGSGSNSGSGSGSNSGSGSSSGSGSNSGSSSGPSSSSGSSSSSSGSGS